MTNPVASLAALLRERAMKLISDNSLSISRADPAALAHGKAAGLYEAAAEIEARGVREPLEFCEMSDGSRMPACEGHPTGEAVKANMRAGAAPPREPIKDQFAQAVAGALRDFAREVAGDDECLPWLTEILVEELAPRVTVMADVLAIEHAAEVENEHGIGHIPDGDRYQETLANMRAKALFALKRAP